MTTRRLLSHPTPRALVGSVLVAIALATTTIAVGLSANLASADSEDDLQAQRSQWQKQYRHLLSERARYTFNITKSEKNYAVAQRRNYPRGKGLQHFLDDIEESKRRLAQNEEQITKMVEDARTAGIPPAWLYEVDDENVTYDPPPARQRSWADEGSDEDDGDGRNPLYREDDPDDDS